ncbi:uncharacterized protein V1518DRAFT_423730 [Limtongia smithiae]|uniref:uncharacterized protein n=1 Tax=Limtongia smithiae TaxID=1125753 RepID=UPI0034CF2DF3
MDLSSLSSTLPRGSTAPLPQPASSPPAVDEELLPASFRDAAVAVTKLYRAANNDILRARERGYLAAIDDLLAVITSGQDVYEWALAKKYVSHGDASRPVPGDEPTPPQPPTASFATPASTAEPERRKDEINLADGTFTFQSALQLDRSHTLPTAAAVAKNARDYLMAAAPAEVLFHALARETEEQRSRMDAPKRRTEDDDGRGGFKRHRY